ncbi:hypothetical protein TBR22_A08170 [Luteitalea sp. TBR-22]|uniref:ATP-grasp domain-containing protein n=1 Tax=Luteitalea sp. TBR-22 TaxID=2802971 RepID=UPI001AF788F8|nr:hypothetical protein [Luteitalea sp. TBR-22]BCS31615.1 hypothetical protein TBR22_A08170 [Luteitalea sp. TBR-22]
MTIFVHDDSLYAPDQWHPRFTAQLTAHGRSSRLVDLHVIGADGLAGLVAAGDGLIARFGHHNADLAATRAMFDRLATMVGGRIFPAPQSYLYYDDKARQASLLLHRGYPTPATAVVSGPDDLDAFVRREGLQWPVVVKQSHGAGSSGVRLAHGPADAEFPCIAQQFCPGNDGDVRINVIGDRAMGFCRANREGDFRASGSGRLTYPESLDPDLLATAWRISRENGFDSMAYDFVRLDGRWVVLEMSYTYVDRAVRDCAWYVHMPSGARRDKVGVYPQDFIVEDFLARLDRGAQA